MSVALRNGCYGSTYSRVAKPEKSLFYQEIGGCYKGTIILKNSVPIRIIPFKCIFVRLEKHLCEEKNEPEIPVALYIRLEYSHLTKGAPYSSSLCKQVVLDMCKT